MKARYLSAIGLAVVSTLILPPTLPGASAAIVGWNNLGMHCMDSDYSVFSILPPYNTIEAQLIVGGKLLTTNGSGYSITYQAIPDATGSSNTTSIGKGNFYDYTAKLYGAVATDMGLKGWAMPGPGNTPQFMIFEKTNEVAPDVLTPVNWFRAEGIPITPFDDAGRKNPYPLMRLIARDPSNVPVATNDIVLPVSDEMDCRLCHASGSGPDAMPPQGWVWASNPERDYRLNILRLHDSARFLQMGTAYGVMLATNGFNALGLYRSVVADSQPVLCAKCHLSEALPGTGVAGVPQLTTSVHGFHAHVTDPILGTTLDNANNRESCYRCHPGSATKCLRGAMGKAVATDGTMAMQCQSCHGEMSKVGSPTRVGWLNEPTCQSCHTGTATHNNGQIRYTSAFDNNGSWRVAVDQTFATSSNSPLDGFSLYRFSSGHGGLQCEGCHGSTHAEFPSSHANDNRRNVALQGHPGTLSECSVCHGTTSVSATNYNRGPHGMHPVGQTMAANHGGLFDRGATVAGCAACHGTDLRGTVLSRAQNTRTLTTKFGTVLLWPGQQVGCYHCHLGDNHDIFTPYTQPQVANVSTSTTSGKSVELALSAISTTGDPPTFRIISQPQHGSVGITSNTATYFSEPGYVGNDAFTFAASNGYLDSNLATGSVAVAQGQFTISAQFFVPTSYPVGWAVPFGVMASPSNLLGAVQYTWNFGDGTPPLTNQFPIHTYTNTGVFDWRVIASIGSGIYQASTSVAGTITITAAETLQVTSTLDQMLLSWRPYPGDVLLEWTSLLGPATQWTVDTNWVNYGASSITVQEPNAGASRFYRLKKL